jgi:hypothetical protein
MPYKRSLACRQASGIKNKIAKTPANQFFHIFQTGLEFVTRRDWHFARIRDQTGLALWENGDRKAA